MDFLPIVSRELRIAVRKRSTIWLRVAAPVIGLVIAGLFMLVSVLEGAGSAEIGNVLFHVLAWLCLAAGLFVGFFLTSDCLSEEKREGTLGLLFLTDLRGYDVALGKLLATSLRGFYALLAILPILAVPLLMGGVTGPQFWKGSLALVNGLFCSLTAGLFVSAISKESQKALGAAFFALLIFTLGGPATDAIIAGATSRAFNPFFSLSSPGYVLICATAWGRSNYWMALLVNQCLGWSMLALACVLVPRTWQEKPRARAGTNKGWAYAWKYGAPRRRTALRRKLLEHHPIAWLACRERHQSLGLWVMAILTVGGFVAVLIAGASQESWIIWSYLGGLFTLVLYLFAASRACRFLLDSRQSGLLELVLSTPVKERQIIAGQWRALLRLYGLPLLLLLGAAATGAALSQLGYQRVSAQIATVTSSSITNQTGTVAGPSIQAEADTNTIMLVSPAPTLAGPRSVVLPGITVQQVCMAVTAAVAAAITTLANLLALCWFGMWMGMTSRNANLATLKTLLFVQIIPWFIISFGTSIVAGLIMASFLVDSTREAPASWLAWWPLLSAVLFAGVVIAKDAAFILWSRGKLLGSLRSRVEQGFSQPRLFTTVRAPLPGPPVIASS